MHLNGDVPRGGKGARGLMAIATKGLASVAPDLLRERLCEPEFVEKFLASLEAGVGSCDRTCMRLYAEAVKLVGSQVELSVQIVNQIGAQPGEARGYVERGRDAETLAADEHALAARLAGWLADYASRNGTSVEAVFARLSSAEVVEPVNGNGHTNGNGIG